MAEEILIFANSRYPHGAANSVNVFRMVTAFEALGHKVTLYSLRSGSPFKTGLWRETCRRYGFESGAKTRLLWWPFQRGAEPFLAVAAFFSLLLSGRHTKVYTRVRYVAALSDLLGFPTYFECHAPPLTALQKTIDRRIAQSQRCRLIVISQGLRNAYRNLGINTERTILAPDAGRPNRFSPPQQGEFHGPAIEVGYIGSLHKGRGSEIILALARRSPHRRFHVIGRRPDSMISSNGHSANVFFYDEVTPNQADRLASLFDVLLMPYQKQVTLANGLDTSSWMSPMKMFEFMLSGRPIIASRLPTICEILKNSEEALLVEPSDETSWLHALEKLDDPNLRWHLAQNAYRKASERHTWEIRAQSILEDA